jgi:hypothetical protein
LNLNPADDVATIGQGRVMLGNLLVPVNPVARDRRPKAKPRGIHGERIQFGNLLEVHEQIRFVPAHPHLVDQIRPSGQRAGLAVLLREQSQSGIERQRSLEIKIVHKVWLFLGSFKGSIHEHSLSSFNRPSPRGKVRREVLARLFGIAKRL